MQPLFQKKLSEGETLTIRYPSADDAPAMCHYINSLSAEQTFIRYQGETVTLEEETTFLQALLQKIQDHKAVFLLAFVNDQLIGIANIELKEKTESHEGVLGISIAKNFRGRGIGTTLLQKILEEGVKQLPNLQLITLGVFETNTVAQAMYEKCGFKEYGRLPKGIQYKGALIDHVYMYKAVVK